MKRNEDTIMREIVSIYNGLSPENVWCDGEASPAAARATMRRLNGQLKLLFSELGRNVSEGEAYDWDNRRRS